MLMQNLSPFIVSIAQYLYLRERIRFYEFINMIFCFIILFVLCYFDEHRDSWATGSLMGYLLGMASTAFFAMTYIIPKQITIHNIPQYNAVSNIFGVVLYLLLSFLQCCYRLLINGQLSIHLSLQSILFCCICGLLGFGVSHFFLLATRFEKPSRLASLEFLGVLFGYCIDFFTGYKLSLLEVLCCLLLTVGGMVILKTKNDEISETTNDFQINIPLS